MPRFSRWLLLLLVQLTSRAGSLAGQGLHPLDPLTWQEHWTLLEVLRDAGRYDDSTRVALVNLSEPAKGLVWGWKPGTAAPRAARAVLRRGGKNYETVVDLVGRRVVSWKEAEGQANWLGEEFKSMEDEVKQHPQVVAALARRGIKDLTFVECEGLPPGRFGRPEEEGRRLAHYACHLANGGRNPWGRSIEGLDVLVDVDRREVLKVDDEGPPTSSPANIDFDLSAVGPLRKHATRLGIDQPDGPSFTLDGNQVRWDRWSFHVRPDQRVGMIIGTVRYRDHDRDRTVLYEGSLSEISVPYMDPSIGWYNLNFMDAGEFVTGGLAHQLIRGIDCPTNAQYLSQVVVKDNGHPRDGPDVICLFERPTGDVAWRHEETTIEGRPKRDLVVRFTAVLGNYDYVFDWVFQPDGTIRVAVGATGIAESKVVAERSAADRPAGGPDRPRADAYGRFVDRNIVAVNHDHFFSFRLDLDVDGAANSFERDRLETVRLPAEHPRRSIWAMRGETAKREQDAMLDVDMDYPSLWRITSPTARNANGYPTSYQILPGMTANTLLSEDDWPRQRAGFTNHHLWITPYAADEQYAAGMYPTLSRPGEGLPRWTSRNRGIEQTDIVAWVTVGLHHVVRAEDWPVMPVVWHSFELRPFDFFDRNPALDLPLEP
jgi:primary-amine oxidase